MKNDADYFEKQNSLFLENKKKWYEIHPKIER